MTNLLKSKTVSGKTIRAARRQILVIGPDTKICPHSLTLKVTFFIQFLQIYEFLTCCVTMLRIRIKIIRNRNRLI